MLAVLPLPLYMSAVNRAGPLSFMSPPPLLFMWARSTELVHCPSCSPPSSLYERGQQSWSIVLHALPLPLYMSAVNRAGPLSFMLSPFPFIWARSTELVHCPSCSPPLLFIWARSTELVHCPSPLRCTVSNKLNLFFSFR